MMLRRFAILLAALLLAAPLPARAEAVLRVAVDGGDRGQIDPHRATATIDIAPVGWMFNGLVRFRPGTADPTQFEPDLAERWESSADGLTWTFHLRRGVRFHGDWGELTAEDVRYSLQRAADPSRSSFSNDFLALDRVEVVDPYTVRIVLKTPVPSLLGLLSNYKGGQIVSRRAEAEMGERFRGAPVGTGPFAYADYATQSHLTLVANENYFRGRPQIDRIVVRYIPSDSARELAFTSGEIDLFKGRTDQRWIERMRAAGAQVEVFGPGEFRTLHLNMTAGPLADRRVREAIVRALDVRQMVQFVGADIAVPAAGIIPPGFLGQTADGWNYPFDLARSRALLAEAGYPQGFTIRSITSAISSLRPYMELIQAQLRRAGIEVQLDIVDHATFHAQIRQDLSPMTLYGAARFPIADSYFREFYHSRATVVTPTAAANFSHCAAADDEIDRARVEPDRERQVALWQAAQRKIHEAICTVPLYDMRQIWVRSPRLEFGYPIEGSLNLAPAVTEISRLR